MATNPRPDLPAPDPDPGPTLGSKHQATRAAILARPTRVNVRWHDVEALLVALGGVVHQRAGSRVGVVLNGFRLHRHTPHPQPGMKQPQIRDVRDFLETLGY